MGKENVPLPPSIARPAQKGGTEFPAMFWSPEGDNKVFAAAGDVPEGWTPYHPSNTPEKPTAASAPPMKRKDVVAALKQGGIEFDAAASHESLYDLLLGGVRNALAETKIVYDAGETDVKKLLALFPAG